LAREAVQQEVLAALQVCRTDSDTELRNLARQTTRLVYGEFEGKTTMAYVLKNLNPAPRHLDLHAGAQTDFALALRPVLRQAGLTPGLSASLNPAEQSLAKAGFEPGSADLVTLDHLSDPGLLETAVGMLKDKGLLTITFSQSSTPEFVEGVIDRIRQMLENDLTHAYDFSEIRVPEGYPVNHLQPALSDNLLLVKKHAALPVKPGRPGAVSVYQKAQTQERASKTNRFEYGRSASDPANPMLQIWRVPRLLGMFILSGVFLVLDRLAKTAGEQGSFADRQTLQEYLRFYETRFFPLNTVEAEQDASRLVQGGVFEKGSLIDRVVGNYRVQDERPLLALDATLVQAACTLRGQEEQAGLSTLVRLRARTAQSLIRQIYYYRSADYYGLTLGARWEALWGQATFRGRRLEVGNAILRDFLNSGERQDQANELAGLQAYSQRLRNLGVAVDFLAVRYLGEDEEGRAISSLAMPRSATLRERGLLLERLKGLHFEVDEQDRQRILPRRFRLSPLAAA
jgi:hypothetical protein